MLNNDEICQNARISRISVTNWCCEAVQQGKVDDIGTLI